MGKKYTIKEIIPMDGIKDGVLGGSVKSCIKDGRCYNSIHLGIDNTDFEKYIRGYYKVQSLPKIIRKFEEPKSNNVVVYLRDDNGLQVRFVHPDKIDESCKKTIKFLEDLFGEDYDLLIKKRKESNQQQKRLEKKHKGKTFCS